MLATIASLNEFTREAGITEVSSDVLLTFCHGEISLWYPSQPSLMNFCVTDGETVVATRYVSSKVDEAASLVNYQTFLTWSL